MISDLIPGLQIQISPYELRNLLVSYRHVIPSIAGTPPQSQKPIQDLCNQVCN